MSPDVHQLVIHPSLPKTTVDGRFWWPGVPPGDRIPWDIRIVTQDGGLILHEEVFTSVPIHFSRFAGTPGIRIDQVRNIWIPIQNAINRREISFAFPKAGDQIRWVPLDDAKQRIQELPDVFSLWEARYAITQLEVIWPNRPRVAVNYTEWQPNRRNKA